MGWKKPRSSDAGCTHEHINLNVLNSFTIGVNGELLFDGQPIEGDMELPEILMLFTRDAEGNLLFNGQFIQDKRLKGLAATIDELNKLSGVTWNVQDQFNANNQDLQSHTQRLQDLKLAIDNMSTTDEKVSMDASGTPSYLLDLIDNLTIKNVNGKLTIDGLNGLIASINELNFLQGTTANIQQQIDSLRGVSNFRGVFTSYEGLELAPDPQPGEYAIVSDGSTSDYYFYYGNTWGYSHATTSATSIDLATNTTGILPKNRYEKQTASETLLFILIFICLAI